jgi:hypothetical protein
MKNLILKILLLVVINQSQAQVGIGTNTPDNSAILDVQSSDRGILFPRMTSSQRNAITAPALGLQVFDTNTNSLWYFNGTLWINTIAEALYGDVKSGFQSGDHSGWVLLDGRGLSSLTANQQTVAIEIGFGSTIPDATSAYLVQNGGVLGEVSGSNTKLISQSNLPNITLSGNTDSAGDHSHSATSASSGQHNHTGTTSTDSHSHTGSTSTDSHSHSYNDRGYGGTGFVAAEETNLTECAEYDSFNRTTSTDSHNHTITTSSDSHNHTFTTSNN